MNHRLRRPALAGLLFALTIGSAFATTSWMKTFSGLYTRNSQTALRASKCAICHVTPKGKGGLNCYGKLLKGKTPSASALQSIECLDADNDGVGNITEIRAGTLPGDPKSKP